MSIIRTIYYTFIIRTIYYTFITRTSERLSPINRNLYIRHSIFFVSL